MSKEQFESILIKLTEVKKDIEALPGSSANGLLIDAASHIKNSVEHLKRYFQLIGAEK